MKKIILIRHAESESNAGGIFEHNRLVRLSETGKKQAKDLVEILDRPDRVIVSKFIRTQETAEPLLQKHQDVETHLWLDTHEFDYLDRRNFIGKPKEKFDAYAKNYWKQCDPFIKYLDDKESFKEFVGRVHGAILKCEKLVGVNYIFTHGHFIATFGHLVNNYSRTKFEESTQDDKFYCKLMQELNHSYDAGTYLQAKNTEVIDVTKLVENYLA